MPPALGSGTSETVVRSLGLDGAFAGAYPQCENFQQDAVKACAAVPILASLPPGRVEREAL
jgi:hypothetical protein